MKKDVFELVLIANYPFQHILHKVYNLSCQIIYCSIIFQELIKERRHC